MDQPPLAIDHIPGRRGIDGSGIPQEAGPDPLLDLVQRIVKLSGPFFTADKPWKPLALGISESDCAANHLADDATVHAAV